MVYWKLEHSCNSWWKLIVAGKLKHLIKTGFNENQFYIGSYWLYSKRIVRFQVEFSQAIYSGNHKNKFMQIHWSNKQLKITVRKAQGFQIHKKSTRLNTI